MNVFQNMNNEGTLEQGYGTPTAEPVTIRDFAQFHRNTCPNRGIDHATTEFVNTKPWFTPTTYAETIIQRHETTTGHETMDSDRAWFYAKDKATDIVMKMFNTTLPPEMATEVLEETAHLIQRELFRAEVVEM